MAYWNCGAPTARKVRFRIYGELGPKVAFVITGYLVVDARSDEGAIDWTQNIYGARDLVEHAEDIDCDVYGDCDLSPRELLRDAVGPLVVDLSCDEDA